MYWTANHNAGGDTIAESRFVQLNTDKIKYGKTWDDLEMAMDRHFVVDWGKLVV